MLSPTRPDTAVGRLHRVLDAGRCPEIAADLAVVLRRLEALEEHVDVMYRLATPDLRPRRFAVGDVVAMVAELGAGPFPGEHVATVAAEDGRLSGRVRDRDLLLGPGEVTAVLGVVQEVTDRDVLVYLHGSYPASATVRCSLEWAERSLRKVT